MFKEKEIGEGDLRSPPPPKRRSTVATPGCLPHSFPFNPCVISHPPRPPKAMLSPASASSARHPSLCPCVGPAPPRIHTPPPEKTSSRHSIACVYSRHVSARLTTLFRSQRRCVEARMTVDAVARQPCVICALASGRPVRRHPESHHLALRAVDDSAEAGVPIRNPAVAGVDAESVSRRVRLWLLGAMLALEAR